MVKSKITDEADAIIRAHSQDSLPKIQDCLDEELGFHASEKTLRKYMRKHNIGQKLTRICSICGKEFEVDRFDNRGQAYCSVDCRTESYRRMNQSYQKKPEEKENVSMACVCCGKVFTKWKYSTSKTCSPECKRIERNRWQRENRRKRKEAIAAELGVVTEHRRKRKSRESTSINNVERNRKAEGRYESYGQYVAAHEMPVSINVPDWARKHK